MVAAGSHIQKSERHTLRNIPIGGTPELIGDVLI